MNKITICNMAIGFVGGTPIMSFDDETVEAEQCSLFYDVARTFCLESRDWTFASANRKLSSALSSPDSEFAFGFQIPADCLVVRIVSESTDMKTPEEYQKDGRVIWADAAVVYIKYTKDITDTALFSPTFQTAVAHKLAEFISTTISGDKVLKRALMTESNEMLEEGGSIDGMQGSPKRAYASKLLRARFRGGRYGTGDIVYPWGY